MGGFYMRTALPENPTRPDAILWQGPYLGPISAMDVGRMAEELTKRNVFFHRAFPHQRQGARYLIIEGWKKQPPFMPDIPTPEYLDALIFGETTHAQNDPGRKQPH
jgi:hypothetical protein